MSKKISYSGSYYDCTGFERWLNDRSSEGLRLKDFTLFGKIPLFEETEPNQVYYYVEPDFDQYTSEQAENAYTDLGWKYLGERRGACLIYESEDPWAIKPRKQFESSDQNKKWRKMWINLLCWIGLNLYSIYTLLFDLSQLVYYPEMYIYGVVVWITFLLLTLFLLFEMIEYFYDIITWNRCVRLREEPSHWKGIVVLRGLIRLILWLLILVLCFDLMILLRN